MRFFFYGTLMDADLLSAVIGRRIEPSDLKPVILRGFSRISIIDIPYPFVIPDKYGATNGVIIEAISLSEQRRLMAYESPGYALRLVTVETPKHLRAKTFIFAGDTSTFKASKKIWSLEHWQKRYKEQALAWVTRGR